MTLVAPGDATWGWGVLQLPKTRTAIKVPPSVAIKTWHPQALTPPPSKDWFLSSLATA